MAERGIQLFYALNQTFVFVAQFLFQVVTGLPVESQVLQSFLKCRCLLLRVPLIVHLNIIVMRTLLLATVVILVCCRSSHFSWYTAPRFTLATSDVAWNYCDMKCLQFESKAPGYDFVVVFFRNSIYKPNFASCYVHHHNGTYALWNTVVRNSFY
mgnify:FL=1